MNREDWDACTDPVEMLHHLIQRESISPRKLRLFVAAAYDVAADRDGAAASSSNSNWPHYVMGKSSPWASHAPIAEFAVYMCRSTHHSATLAHLLCDIALPPWLIVWRKTPGVSGQWPVGSLINGDALWLDPSWLTPGDALWLDPSWLTPDVLALARSAQTVLPSGSTGLPADVILALSDALEDAGCAESLILGHLRAHQERFCEQCWRQGVKNCPACKGRGKITVPDVHVRGCWVVDLLLDQE